jgi:hypothetical protein
MKRALQVLLFTAFSAATLPVLAQHLAAINQQGSGGTATINQVMGIAPFEANITQGPGTGSDAAILQDGIDLHATINQTGDGQHAHVVQVADGARATVTQTGSDNTASVEQRAVSAIANVVQLGSANEASIFQNGRTLRADVTQTGMGNSVRVTQDTLMSQRVSVEQHGSNNRGDVALDGPDGNSAALVQAGTDNLAMIRGTGLLAVIDQEGAGNMGDISLDGAGSQGTIRQRGTANRASIISVGDNNLAIVRQGGQNNLAIINQNGSGLVAAITQNTVNPGVGNVASITQR